MTRTTKATLEWYRTHQTKEQIGWDPDGMCLKVCRTARAIPARYPSALAAQVATPPKYRVYNIEDFQKGMVVYFDDPRDNNPFGHIVTIQGRVANADRSRLGDLLLWTNSVKANELVLVRGDYFEKHWGDKLQFAAKWLNGVELDLPQRKPRLRVQDLHDAIEELKSARSYHRSKGDQRIVDALTRDIKEIRETIRKFK